jgi:hypothetical protein
VKGRRRKGIQREPTLAEILSAHGLTERGRTRDERLRLWRGWEKWENTRGWLPPYFPAVEAMWLERWRESGMSPETFLEELREKHG